MKQRLFLALENAFSIYKSNVKTASKTAKSEKISAAKSEIPLRPIG